MTKLDVLLKGLGNSVHSGGEHFGKARSDAEWDDSADAIARVAVSQGVGSQGATSSDSQLIDSLLAAPSLPREPGEPSSVVGDFKMSSDRDTPGKSDSGAHSVSSPPASLPPTSARPRGSLKEMAQRVSKAPPSSSIAPRSSSSELPRASVAPVSAVAATLPGAVSAPPPSQSPASVATATPLPVSAPPASLRISEAAPPVSSAPPSGGAAIEASASPASRTPATLPTGVTPIGAPPRKSGAGPAIGVALTGLAVAAGVFFYITRQKPVEAPPVAAQEQTQPSSTAKPEAKTADTVAQAPKPADDGALDINKLGDATASATAVALGGPLPTGGAAPSAAPIAANDEKKIVKVNPDGTLDEAMQKAAGPNDGKHEDGAQPAAEGPKNLPDAPPQGSVTAALGAVKGAAKACVSGADDVSSASVIFGSSGAVQSVSVSGWAAGKPAASCIQAALKGANVGPFSKPTFGPVPVTIRP